MITSLAVNWEGSQGGRVSMIVVGAGELCAGSWTLHGAIPGRHRMLGEYGFLASLDTKVPEPITQ